MHEPIPTHSVSCLDDPGLTLVLVMSSSCDIAVDCDVDCDVVNLIVSKFK